MKTLKKIFIKARNAIKKITSHYFNISRSNDSLDSTSTESNVIQPSFDHKDYIEIKEEVKDISVLLTLPTTHRFAIHIDKLILGYELSEVLDERLLNRQYTEISDNLILLPATKRKHPTYSFEYMIYIRREGVIEPFASIYFGNNTPYKQYIFMAIENNIFYERKLHYIYNIEHELGLYFQFLSQIEIALDTDYDLYSHFMNDVYQNEKLVPVIFKKAYKNMEELVNSVIFFSKGSRKNISQNISMEIRNNKKNMRLRIYDKSKEIQEQSPYKTYIQDNIQCEQIYRAEIILKNEVLKENLKKIGTNIDYFYYNQQILSDEWLLKLYLISVNRIIRVQDPKKRKSYNLIEYLFCH